MTIIEIETIKRELGEINSFVRERFDPVSSSVDLLREETERLERSVLDLQQRDRAARRESLLRQAGDDSPLTVPEGPYAGMDVLGPGAAETLRLLAASGGLRTRLAGENGGRPSACWPTAPPRRRSRRPTGARPGSSAPGIGSAAGAPASSSPSAVLCSSP